VIAVRRGAAAVWALLSSASWAWPPAPTPHAAALLEMVNASRAVEGLAPVVSDPVLCVLARTVARRLVRDNPGPLTHTPGPVLQDVAESLGSGMGEVLARGYDPADVVPAWLASPTHNAVLLHASYARVGFGVAQADNGTLFAVGLFGAPVGVSA
jgi:uncharacterized protein YkwD